MWPPGSRFPANHSIETVKSHVWSDLLDSAEPLVVAGYSSIAQLVDFVAAWDVQGRNGTARVVLGTEPFTTRRPSFGSGTASFTDDVQRYWYGRGISLRHSAKIISALAAIAEQRLEVRFVDGTPGLHAKVYVGDEAATLGSSNFTHSGLSTQVETNARFTRLEDSKRFEELRQIGGNLWDLGEDWTDQFRQLLEDLLKVVTWREALARACAELLEGEWARDGLGASSRSYRELWPSQQVGIAQAMWIVENVGSVLVADATGSGKTRMGAHLVCAVRDWVLQTGRTRRDLTVLVCPPSVQRTWDEEAAQCRLTLNIVSHGRLSRRGSDGPQLPQAKVQAAQILAVDEAHNFLNAGSNRTQFLRRNLADHVLLFTATPISRGASDLLDLVALLGPDNFDDETHEILRKLEGNRVSSSLEEDEARILRAEIQRFTLRRTKRQINALVDQQPESYEHGLTGRICRYPTHAPHAYDTNESAGDVEAAREIRFAASELRGIAMLSHELALPTSMRRWFNEEQWLAFRLQSAAGLSAHHVMGALRSSRAALHEHLHGTPAATVAFGLDGGFKSTDTGDRIARVLRKAELGPPTSVPACDAPEWLIDSDAWRVACAEEAAIYRRISDALDRIGPAREVTKAELLFGLLSSHNRVLSFDGHLITLAAMAKRLGVVDAEIIVATGESRTQRRRVERLFAPDASGRTRVVALCSDAMNEGLNLQGASAVVHLDLPTTLRVAEQRVGRVDRMDSPHDEIEAWWPRDGEAFATRARERLLMRFAESRTLLGQNMPVPELGGSRIIQDLQDDEIVEPERVQEEVEALLDQRTDEIVDALDPVRSLVEGDHAVVSRAEYSMQRRATHRVLARVAPVAAEAPWAFFAVRSSLHSVPRWMFVEPDSEEACISALPRVVERLRTKLVADPPNHALDGLASEALDRCLVIAAEGERALLPRKLQRALDQMAKVANGCARQARRDGDEELGIRWRRLAEFALPSPDDRGPDAAATAEAWLGLVADRLESYRTAQPRRRYVLLGDITPSLIKTPLAVEDIEGVMSEVPIEVPFEDRVAACIVGVPTVGPER